MSPCHTGSLFEGRHFQPGRLSDDDRAPVVICSRNVAVVAGKSASARSRLRKTPRLTCCEWIMLRSAVGRTNCRRVGTALAWQGGLRPDTHVLRQAATIARRFAFRLGS